MFRQVYSFYCKLNTECLIQLKYNQIISLDAFNSQEITFAGHYFKFELAKMVKIKTAASLKLACIPLAQLNPLRPPNYIQDILVNKHDFTIYSLELLK